MNMGYPLTLFEAQQVFVHLHAWIFFFMNNNEKMYCHFDITVDWKSADTPIVKSQHCCIDVYTYI